MRSIKKIPNKPYAKGFDMGWGRAVACAIHYIENHVNCEEANPHDTDGPMSGYHFVNFNRNGFIEYMCGLREKQLRAWNNSSGETKNED